MGVKVARSKETKVTDEEGQKVPLPELIKDLQESVRDLLEETGVMTWVAREVAEKLGGILMGSWGGVQIYIPKGAAVTIKARDARIREQFEAGTTVDKLCREFRLTRARIYMILKE